MNVKTTIALVALLAVVGAYLYFFERNEPAPPIDPSRPSAVEPEGERLLSEDTPEAKDGSRITVTREAKTTVLQRQGEKWVEVEPVQFPLSDYSVNALVDDITDLRYVQKLKPGQGSNPSLTDAALDPPQAVLTYAPNEDVSIQLSFGRTLLGGHGYVMLEGDDHLYVVTDDLHKDVVDGELTEWRKKSFDPPNVDQADRFTLISEEGQIELYKVDGKWFLDEPATQRASEDKVKSVADGINYLNVDEFVKDNPPAMDLYGLDKPAYMVSVRRAEDQAVYTLRIGGPADLKSESFFATWSTSPESSNVVFSIDKSDVEPFDKKADDLRDPKLFTIAADEIQQLRVERGGRTPIDLMREADALAFSDPGPGYGLDQSSAEEFLDDLVALEAESYTLDISRPDSEATATVELTRRGTGQQRVQFFKEDEQLVARVGGETVGYRLPAEKAEFLFQPVLSLRHRTVVDLPENEMKRLTLQRRDATYAFVCEGEQWRLDAHDGFEDETYTQLREALAPIQAESWSEQTVDPTITLTVETADQNYELQVDGESGQATFSGIDAAFTLGPETLDLLKGEYRDRSVLAISLDDLTSVTIDQDDKVMTLRRDAEGNYEADKLADVDQSKAADLFNALAELRAERYREARQAGVNLKSPYVTLILKTADGTEHRVALWQSDEPRPVLGRLGDADRLFELSASSVEDFDFVLKPEEEEEQQ